MLKFKEGERRVSEKICSATYDYVNIPRSSSIRFATVKFKGRGVEWCEKKKT